MLVRNLVSWSGHHFSHVPGDIVDLPEDMAEARMDAGLAEPAPEGAETTAVHKLDDGSVRGTGLPEPRRRGR
jgi:hypothetical protein